MRALSAKLALVGTAAVISATMFATVALAAPTLPAGTTSGPHNSRGTCANCHSFKSALASQPAPAPAQSTAPAQAAPSAPSAGSQPLITITIYGPAGAQTIAVGQPYAAPSATVVDTTATSFGGDDGDDD